MSWFSCLAVPASFPCCANVNRTSCWAPKNTTSRQPHSWQLLFMALPKWMGISVQTFHHAPAATHKSHWFPANLHLFYSRRLKQGRMRERHRQGARERENIYNDLKDLKRRKGIAFEKDLRDRNWKRKKWSLHFTAVLSELEMGNIYIPKMTQLKCLYLPKLHFLHNYPVSICSVFLVVQSIVFLWDCARKEKVFLSLLK